MHVKNAQEGVSEKVFSSLLLRVRIKGGIKILVISRAAVGIWVPCKVEEVISPAL